MLQTLRPKLLTSFTAGMIGYRLSSQTVTRCSHSHSAPIHPILGFSEKPSFIEIHIA